MPRAGFQHWLLFLQAGSAFGPLRGSIGSTRRRPESTRWRKSSVTGLSWNTRQSPFCPRGMAAPGTRRRIQSGSERLRKERLKWVEIVLQERPPNSVCLFRSGICRFVVHTLNAFPPPSARGLSGCASSLTWRRCALGRKGVTGPRREYDAPRATRLTKMRREGWSPAAHRILSSDPGWFRACATPPPIRGRRGLLAARIRPFHCRRAL